MNEIKRLIPIPSAAATREALLNAAEEILGERGVEGTSIRDIIKAAGTNLGAVNYHFGSKDRLVMEVFMRRMRPVDQERIARLDAVEKSAGKGPLALAEVMDAFIRPLIEAQRGGSRHAIILKLIGRGFQEVDPEVRALVHQELAILTKRFDAAFLRAVPGLPPEELPWRIMFFIGAMHFGIDLWTTFDQRPASNPQIQPKKLNPEELIQRLVAFVTAGMAASVPKTKGKKK
jgi:AcrR family transcriptional regulator